MALDENGKEDYACKVCDTKFQAKTGKIGKKEDDPEEIKLQREISKNEEAKAKNAHKERK